MSVLEGCGERRAGEGLSVTRTLLLRSIVLHACLVLSDLSLTFAFVKLYICLSERKIENSRYDIFVLKRLR